MYWRVTKCIVTLTISKEQDLTVGYHNLLLNKYCEFSNVIIIINHIHLWSVIMLHKANYNWSYYSLFMQSVGLQKFKKWVLVHFNQQGNDYPSLSFQMSSAAVITPFPFC